MMGASNCSTAPKWDARFYVGDSANGAITRNNPPEPADIISCFDSRVDNYVCVSFDDLKELYEILQRCKQWEQ